MSSITSRTSVPAMFSVIHKEILRDQSNNVEQLMAIAAQQGLAAWAG